MHALLARDGNARTAGYLLIWTGQLTGPAERSCCSTSTTLLSCSARVHCELPNCNSHPLCLFIKLYAAWENWCCRCSASAPERVMLFHQIIHLLHFHLFVFSTQQYFWRCPPIHNRFHCFTIRFCQFGGSRDWGSVYGVRCKSLLPGKPPQAESDTWYRQHSSVQLCAHIFLSELKILLNWHPSFCCVYAQFNLGVVGCAQQ